ncbi:MAG: M20/M25/M40 family metallo-hydrolase [Acetanaerobacterium sp.]
MNMLSKPLLDGIEKHFDEAFDLSMWLTTHPEISGEEKESSRHVIEFLRERGYTVESPYCGVDYSFRAHHENAKDSGKPKIAIMCEYDALPEVGHACGHSISCAISLLSALALNDAFKDFPFQVDLIGTPAEETIGGKVILARNGAFDGYAFAIMGHIDSINAPQIRVLACNDMYITFKGVSAHASTRPWEGVSALNAAQLFMHAVDLQRVHYKPFMQIHGIIEDGGKVPNTIPDKVVLDYYLRAQSLKELEELHVMTLRSIKGVALATGTTYTVKQRYDTYAELFYPPTATQVITELFEEIGEAVEPMELPEGSTDAGNVDVVIPTFHLEIKGSDTYTNFHTKEFEKLMYGERAKKTLRNGTRVIAGFIQRLAFDSELFEKIKEEYRAYRA